MRLFSVGVLVLVSVGAVLGERERVVDYLGSVGVVVTLFCLISLSVGYAGARVFSLSRSQSIASAMEVGVHNTTIALTIALSVLESTTVAIPSAVYSVVMYAVAVGFGYVVTRSWSQAG